MSVPVFGSWPQPRRCARWQAPLLRAALRLAAGCRRLDLGERLEIALARRLGMPAGDEPDHRLVLNRVEDWTPQEERLFEEDDEWLPAMALHQRRLAAAKYGRWWLRECVRASGRPSGGDA